MVAFPQNKKVLLIFTVDDPLNLSKKPENPDDLAPGKVGVGGNDWAHGQMCHP